MSATHQPGEVRLVGAPLVLVIVPTLAVLWFVTTRSVDRCITTLRSKTEADPQRPTWIRTSRDVGYRFENVVLETDVDE